MSPHCQGINDDTKITPDMDNNDPTDRDMDRNDHHDTENMIEHDEQQISQTLKTAANIRPAVTRT